MLEFHLRHRFIASFTILILAAARPAFAGESNAAPDLVVGPAIAVQSNELSSSELARAEEPLASFSRATGSRWRVLDWAPVTLTPRVAYGTGIDLGRSVRSAQEAEAAARELIAREPALFQTDGTRLTLWKAHPGMGKWSLHFRETIGGLEILGSKVTVLMTEDGHLAAFGATTFPMIHSAVSPALSADQALHIADARLEDEGFLTAATPRSRASVNGPYLLPSLNGATIEGHTVYRVALATQLPPAAFEVDVDAVDGSVHQRRDVLRALEVTGTATGSFEDPGYCDGAAVSPAARLFVNVDGLGTVTTGIDGSFSAGEGGTSPRAVTAELKGAVVDVFNSVGAQASYSGVVTPGTPLAILWNDTNSAPDERDTFYHVEATHRLLQSIDPAWHDLDFPLPANVNVQSSCNAVWDGEAINMYHEAGGCANTGRIGDVVAHEYGHGVTDYMYGPNDPPSDLHEGNSDVLGTFRSNNPVVGPGFYLGDCVNGLRTVYNDMRWPDDLQGEGHHDGLIIAGFEWDMRTRLIQQLGYAQGSTLAMELWHFARELGLPYTQPEQVLWNLLVDDDDANLDSGTPHYDAICAAALHHGFTCPERFDAVVIHHIPLEYGDSPNHAAIPVEADIYSLDAPIVTDSLGVYWRPSAQGSFSRVPMSFVMGQTYRGLIPGQNVGKGVDYYIVARDQLGNTLRRPTSGFNTFLVVYAHDAFEAAGAWTVGAPSDNATTGVWEIADPIGTKLGPSVLQPEDDATANPGHQCWITGQYTGGQPYLSDADGTTTILSPVYNLTGMTWAVVRYNRWFQTLAAATGQLDVGVSYNGGTTWTRLELVTGTQSPPSWRPISKNITPQIGSLGQTRFRVVMLGAPLPSVEEAGFDDFALLAADQGSPSAAPEASPGEGELLLRVATANPSTDLAALEWALPGAADATVALYAIDGSLVRTLARGEMAAGAHRVEWDGKDADGRRVASGVYFVRLTTPLGSVVRRLMIAR